MSNKGPARIGQNGQGETISQNGRQVFVLGRTRILISEHFPDRGRPLESLLEDAIRHAEKQAGN